MFSQYFIIITALRGWYLNVKQSRTDLFFASFVNRMYGNMDQFTKFCRKIFLYKNLIHLWETCKMLKTLKKTLLYFVFPPVGVSQDVGVFPTSLLSPDRTCVGCMRVWTWSFRVVIADPVIETSDCVVSKTAARHHCLWINQNGFGGTAFEWHCYINWHLLDAAIWSMRSLRPYVIPLEYTGVCYYTTKAGFQALVIDISLQYLRTSSHTQSCFELLRLFL